MPHLKVPTLGLLCNEAQHPRIPLPGAHLQEFCCACAMHFAEADTAAEDNLLVNLQTRCSFLMLTP